MKKYTANIITLIRIVGVAFIFALTPYKSLDYQCYTVEIFVFLMITDFVDGKVARSRFGQVTNLGKIIDPMADKLLVLVYLPLIEMNQIASFPVALLFARDIVITNLRVIAAKNGHIFQARMSGKLKTFIAFPLALLLLARVKIQETSTNNLHEYLRQYFILPAQKIPQSVIDAIILIFVAVIIYSFIDYLKKIFPSVSLQ